MFDIEQSYEDDCLSFVFMYLEIVCFAAMRCRKSLISRLHACVCMFAYICKRIMRMYHILGQHACMCMLQYIHLCTMLYTCMFVHMHVCTYVDEF